MEFGREFVLNKYFRYDGPDFSWLVLIIFLIIGCIVWTITEYFLHRFIFHMDEYVPNFFLARLLHFTVHGIHHTIPMDGERLVFPPVLSAVIALFFYPLITNLFMGNAGAIVYGSGVLAYVAYDCMHYFLHHGQLKYEYLRTMRNYHNRHHYDNPKKAYGVSSKYWDNKFGTLLQ